MALQLFQIFYDWRKNHKQQPPIVSAPRSSQTTHIMSSLVAQKKISFALQPGAAKPSTEPSPYPGEEEDAALRRRALSLLQHVQALENAAATVEGKHLNQDLESQRREFAELRNAVCDAFATDLGAFIGFYAAGSNMSNERQLNVPVISSQSPHRPPRSPSQKKKGGTFAPQERPSKH
jgi:hypothetical protein